MLAVCCHADTTCCPLQVRTHLLVRLLRRHLFCTSCSYSCSSRACAPSSEWLCCPADARAVNIPAVSGVVTWRDCGGAGAWSRAPWSPPRHCPTLRLAASRRRAASVSRLIDGSRGCTALGRRLTAARCSVEVQCWGRAAERGCTIAVADRVSFSTAWREGTQQPLRRS